jgi:hypothetical protein
MNVSEIIAKVDQTLQDKTISPVLKDVNDTVAFIAAQSYLPELVTDGVVKFSSAVKTITGATNASPIVITSVAHALSTGQSFVVADVVGNTAANGTWYIEVLSDDTFSLLGSEGNADYVSGGTATRREPSVDMPADYDHDLFKAFSVTQGLDLTIRSNAKSISALYTESERASGELVDIAVESDKLYGLPVPEEDDIVMLSYYRKPTDMVLVSESPTCIPAHLHERLIVSYILSQKYPLIEDDENGKTPNTDKYSGIFGSGIAALRAFYPRPSISRPAIKRTFHFF